MLYKDVVWQEVGISIRPSHFLAHKCLLNKTIYIQIIHMTIYIIYSRPNWLQALYIWDLHKAGKRNINEIYVFGGGGDEIVYFAKGTFKLITKYSNLLNICILLPINAYLKQKCVWQLHEARGWHCRTGLNDIVSCVQYRHYTQKRFCNITLVLVVVS